MARQDEVGKTIGSTDTLLKILEGIMRLDGAGVTEVAQKTEISKGTVYAHLNTLFQQGYVHKEGDKYYVGARFLTFGEYARTRRDVDVLMQAKVRELAESTGELVQFVVEQNGRGIHTFREQGDHAIDLLDTSVGRLGYLHQGSAGKAILAYLPDERVEEIIEEHGLPEKTDETITDPTELETELANIRERGYAVNKGELITGLRAVGAPIRAEDGRVFGAISIAGPKHRLKADRFTDELPDLLRATVNEVELQLSHSSSQSSFNSDGDSV